MPTNGWIRLAGWLSAAVCAAGFTLWLVLRHGGGGISSAIALVLVTLSCVGIASAVALAAGSGGGAAAGAGASSAFVRVQPAKPTRREVRPRVRARWVVVSRNELLATFGLGAVLGAAGLGSAAGAMPTPEALLSGAVYVLFAAFALWSIFRRSERRRSDAAVRNGGEAIARS